MANENDMNLSMSSLILMSSCETGTLKTPWIEIKPRTFKGFTVCKCKDNETDGQSIVIEYFHLFSQG